MTSCADLDIKLSLLLSKIDSRGDCCDTLTAKITQLESKLSTLENKQQSLESFVYEKVNDLQQALNGIAQSIDRKVQDVLDFVIRSLDALRNAFFGGGNDVRLNAIDNRLSNVEQALGHIRNVAEQLPNDIAGLISRIGSLESWRGSIESTIGSFGSRIGTLESWKGSIDGKIQSIENRIQELSSLIDGLLAQFDGKLRTLEQSVDTKINTLDAELRRLIEALRESLTGLVKSLERRLESLQDFVQSEIGKFTTALYQAIEDLRNFILDLLRGRGGSNTDTDWLQRQIDAIDRRLYNVEIAIDNLRRNVDSLTYQISQLWQIIDNITNNNNPADRLNLNEIRSMLSQILYEVSQLKNSPENKAIPKIYKILGGDSWFDADNNIKLRHDPEKKLIDRGKTYYNDNGTKGGELEATSMLGFMENLLTPQYYRAGYHELPGEVPDTLLKYKDGDTKVIKNAIDLQEWQIKQFDGLIGQFPIEIEIADSDPTKPGDQPKKIEFPNISEALAELIGLGVTSTQNSDTSINYLNRLAVELISTKNAAIITQDYARANAIYLGYNGNPTSREIQYVINPLGKSLDEILMDTKGTVVGWKSEDKNSAADYFRRIFYAISLIKESNFVRPKNLERLMTSIASINQQNAEEAESTFMKDLALFNDIESTFNSPRKDNPDIPIPFIKMKTKK